MEVPWVLVLGLAAMTTRASPDPEIRPTGALLSAENSVQGRSSEFGAVAAAPS